METTNPRWQTTNVPITLNYFECHKMRLRSLSCTSIFDFLKQFCGRVKWEELDTYLMENAKIEAMGGPIDT